MFLVNVLVFALNIFQLSHVKDYYWARKLLQLLTFCKNICHGLTLAWKSVLYITLPYRSKIKNKNSVNRSRKFVGSLLFRGRGSFVFFEMVFFSSFRSFLFFPLPQHFLFVFVFFFWQDFFQTISILYFFVQSKEKPRTEKPSFHTNHLNTDIKYLHEHLNQLT